MDRGAWRATVPGVAKSWTRLSDFTYLLRLPQYPLCGGFFFFFNHKWVLNLVKILWFLFFKLLMLCITLTDLNILKNPCLPGINPT